MRGTAGSFCLAAHLPPASSSQRRCRCRDARGSLESQGYDFYLQMLYLFMTALILLLAGTAWSVHASRNPRAWLWPISLLRFCVFIYFEVCYVGVINVFFVAMDCQWLNGSPAMAEHVREYPDVSACLRVRLPAWGPPSPCPALFSLLPTSRHQPVHMTRICSCSLAAHRLQTYTLAALLLTPLPTRRPLSVRLLQCA